MAGIKYKDKKLGRTLEWDYEEPKLDDNTERFKERRKNEATKAVKVMKARFKGKCVKCKREISVGQTIRYHLEQKKAKHISC